MDGAGASCLYRTAGAVGLCLSDAPASRRAAAVSAEAREWSRVEPPLVQILVVVANIQTRTLKTEVEKGSM